MRQADDILIFLNSKLGNESLEWQGDHASVRFDGGVVVDFLKKDHQTVEMVNLVDQFSGQVNSTLSQQLLVANYQGAMTGPFRISLTPDMDTVALCCHIDTANLDSAAFEELLGEFVEIAEYWNGPEAAAYALRQGTELDAVSEANSDIFTMTKL